eukprot:gnl/TRDRNA2_/TRDRNA2_167617_c1_seq1.p1 gnl/TRDRNA2_/TRDRNA2_167617_c1~~gnl/TRDRNA2_/TRDRNA2_167617_c1_seq1.p1  ORF type:complete len:175 (-),score=33.22 gnl/TRDRNA2_/TRDRNA2_167617_c1_seq1:61-534(-)
MPAAAGAGGAVQPGSWLCLCGNVNFPLRTVCNSKKCGLPKEMGNQGPAPGSTGVVMMGGMNTIGGVGMMQKKMGAGGKPPEGSWMCMSCNNVNWPDRTTCNGKGCGQPRAAVDGGYVASSNAKQAPPGSWVCPSCSNVNWPLRTTCNGKNCGQPKPE